MMKAFHLIRGDQFILRETGRWSHELIDIANWGNFGRGDMVDACFGGCREDGCQ